MTESYHGFIDTAHDALLIFEASNQGYLPRVQRRFSDRERQTIRSGAVYVWDEEETGMRRWTDGRTWSPSRVHGCFLIYYELEGRRHQFVNRNSNGSNGRSSRGSHRSSGQASSSPFHMSYDSCPPNIMQKEQGLIKKALSLCMSNKRRLHLVCYYSREDVENGCLISPTNDPKFAHITVSEENFPEVGHSAGRADRHSGGSRSRSSAHGQQRAISAGSVGGRNGPPAYVRSSMSFDKKSTRSGRGEVFRYPSYGPYAGPVRHVNAPASQHHQAAHAVAQAPSPQSTLSSPGIKPSTTAAATTPSFTVPAYSKLSQPQMPPFSPLPPVSAHREEAGSIDDSSQCTQSFHASASTPYIQHPHSYPTSPWQTAPLAPSNEHTKHHSHHTSAPPPSLVMHHQSHQQPLTVAAPVYTPALSPTPSSAPPTQPVWQHSEPPKAYTMRQTNTQQLQQLPPAPAPLWDGNTKGLMIQVNEPLNSTLLSAPHLPGKDDAAAATPHSQPSPDSAEHNRRLSSTGPPHPHHYQQHPSSVQLRPSAPTTDSDGSGAPPQIRLPSIAGFDSQPASPVKSPFFPFGENSSSNGSGGRWSPYSLEGRLWKKAPPSPSQLADAAPKMNSEDMRQLAALRLSLH